MVSHELRPLKLWARINHSSLTLLIPDSLWQKHKYQRTHFMDVFEYHTKPEKHIQLTHLTNNNSFYSEQPKTAKRFLLLGVFPLCSPKSCWGHSLKLRPHPFTIHFQKGSFLTALWITPNFLLPTSLNVFLRKKSGAGSMIRWVKALVVRPEDQSSMIEPRTHVAVRENWF